MIDSPSWLRLVRGNPLLWLLEEENPCVRYRTLTELLDQSASDADVQAAWEWAPVRRIFAALEGNGQWDAGMRPQGNPFRDLDNLARFGVPAGHPALARGCAHLLNGAEEIRGGDCYDPQMVAGLVRYGDLDDPRLVVMIERVFSHEQFYDGNRPGSLRHGRAHGCSGSHSCFSAVARALWAAAGIPEARRTPMVQAFVQRGADYLAAHRVFRANHHRYRPIRPGWLNLHLPFGLDWRTDALDLLDVATRIGLHDSPNVVDALRFLLTEQDADGRWPLEERYNTNRALLSTLVCDVEEVGVPSKWITLTALLQLKRCAGLLERLARGEEIIPVEVSLGEAEFADYPYPFVPADQAQVQSRWASMGMAPVLDELARFAVEHDLQTGWHEGFVMGPANCREWSAAAVKMVPASSMKTAWPVCRVYFLARKGQFTAEGLSQRLGIPLDDSYPGQRKKGNWLDTTLWRIRVEPWQTAWEEVAVALRAPAEFPAVREMMQEALNGFLCETARDNSN